MVLHNANVRVRDGASVNIGGDLIDCEDGIQLADLLEIRGLPVMTGDVDFTRRDGVVEFDTVYIVESAVLYDAGTISYMNFHTVRARDVKTRNDAFMKDDREKMLICNDRVRQFMEELMRVSCHPDRLDQIGD